jgi:hypothetical protein
LSDFKCDFHASILIADEIGVVLELPDQKARGFLVLNVLKQLLPEHAHKVFDEMSVRT